MTAPETAPPAHAAPAAPAYRPGAAIALVARRELRTALLKRSMLITLLLAMAGVIGGIIALDRFVLGDDAAPAPAEVAVVGDAGFLAPAADDPPAGIRPIDPRPAADAAAARAALAAGEVDAAVVPGDAPGTRVILVDSPHARELAGTISGLAAAEARDTALVESGVDPAALAAAEAAAAPEVRDIGDPGGAEVPLALGSVLALMVAVFTFGGATATSVVEEKSSRVVELMLATVRPVHLLAGKILGTAAAGLVMMVAWLGAAAATLAVTGLASRLEMDLGPLAVTLPFFLSGYLLFAACYAAAGSLVSRMEDFQGAQMPVLLLGLVTVYVPAFGWGVLDAAPMRIAAFLPPLSATTAPLQYAAGNLDAAGLAASWGLLTLAAAAVAWVAARIYPRTVLRMGSRVRWAEALRG
ncbi:ABC transporter permease [Corynebacterium sphenisci]|uniref:ABC transporter permease n=1 Tax=Corynebacterium sphenisci TaxID=191493 RepID=UPI0026E02258|nr:ABC transporter permease [Corynebacterium sphenisci]MDO5731394.1 ABC transporter permease [Corynebacterium sphenisci]